LQVSGLLGTWGKDWCFVSLQSAGLEGQGQDKILAAFSVETFSGALHWKALLTPSEPFIISVLGE
jgi:hypothetical protein